MMSSTARPPVARTQARWQKRAGRYVCRAPLWSGSGAPMHLFLGRPLGVAARCAPPAGPTRELEHLRLVSGGRPVTGLQQVHGTTIHRVRAQQGILRVPGDGLSTNNPERALGVQSADCLPILIADRARGSVAALHAGWRGTAAGIALRALEHLSAEYGSKPGDLEVVMGPAAGACCYEIGPDVREAFQAGPLADFAAFRPSRHGRWKVDLAEITARALAAAGVRPRQVLVVSACTLCSGNRLHSYRAEGDQVGRNWSLVAPPIRLRV